MTRTIAITLMALLLAATAVAQGQGPFCGPVGTEGCNAIGTDSSAIVAWATGITVERGPIDISTPGSPLASFGDDITIALGKAGKTTTETVSLGDGGSATLTFDRPIRNGEGPDFAVFENAMLNNTTKGYFLELAFVEVSSDGERFVRFPATSLTPDTLQTSTFGDTDPTLINNLAGKYVVGYGTPFDLEELKDSAGLDVNHVTHVRVVDVVGSILPDYATYDAYGHKVNDPWPTAFNSCGFDLSGVAVLHQAGEAVAEAEGETLRVYPNPATDRVSVCGPDHTSPLLLYDAVGRCVMQHPATSQTVGLYLGQLPRGVYTLRVGTSAQRIVKQ